MNADLYGYVRDVKRRAVVCTLEIDGTSATCSIPKARFDRPECLTPGVYVTVPARPESLVRVNTDTWSQEELGEAHQKGVEIASQLNFV